MKCELKEMGGNKINEVLTEGNKMKHEQWSIDWRKWNETWTMKYVLKEIKWSVNNEVWTKGNKLKREQWSR